MTTSTAPRTPFTRHVGPTSWGEDAQETWNDFRDLVRSGAHPDLAARMTGIPVIPAEHTGEKWDIPAAPKVEFEW